MYLILILFLKGVGVEVFRLILGKKVRVWVEILEGSGAKKDKKCEPKK